jgi:hypothetical protein
MGDTLEQVFSGELEDMKCRMRTALRNRDKDPRSERGQQFKDTVSALASETGADVNTILVLWHPKSQDWLIQLIPH